MLAFSRYSEVCNKNNILLIIINNNNNQANLVWFVSSSSLLLLLLPSSLEEEYSIAFNKELALSFTLAKEPGLWAKKTQLKNPLLNSTCCILCPSTYSFCHFHSKKSFTRKLIWFCWSVTGGYLTQGSDLSQNWTLSWGCELDTSQTWTESSELEAASHTPQADSLVTANSHTKTELSAQTDPLVKMVSKSKISEYLKEPTAIWPGWETFSGFWCNCTWFWDKTFSALVSPGFPGGKKIQHFLFLNVHAAGERARQAHIATTQSRYQSLLTNFSFLFVAKENLIACFPVVLEAAILPT